MAEMARHVRTRIRYDGPALAGHEMDVQDLAPALLAIADIVQIANRKFNGDSASIRVMVDADVEQQCFQLDLSLVQSFLDQAAVLIGRKDVATAKDIAEWIGLISGTGLGLFTLIKRIYGHKSGEQPAVTFRTGDQAGTTIISIAGDVQNLVVPTPTAKLLVDPDVNRNVRTVLSPLQREGYDDLTFIYGDQEVARIDKQQAQEIINSSPVDPIAPPMETISRIRGVVRIKSPQYEGAAKWSLLWQGRAIDAEMADEAAKWVEAFQGNRVSAPPNTVLDVSMSEMVRLDSQGLAVGKRTYVVHEVHSATPPPTQDAFTF
ncbi:hypothetical protein PQ455_14895 [Sphingomonas naphthae]|uniref:Uncharacterized protein n=1 Tax=Sphingomonas naphthae TaxID=1813468 RepID=A0ABY7TKK5_9SPHN|nr:hypothetical protein [Sphingomonas naphthae]WCT72910.1 hypothetical protein PQ455_14895 [Sphingomonas naphthae]